jgi:nucleotide-binding universal stress UspA family protein
MTAVVGDTAQIPDSSVLVVVDNASSAEPLLGWSLHQARRRHSCLHVLYLPAFACAGDRRIVDPLAVELGRKEVTATLDRLGAGSRAIVGIGGRDDSTIEALRAKMMSERHGLVMVGPVPTSRLVRLVFGSDRCGVEAGPEMALSVVPRSAWSTPLPASIPPKLTVGFHGSTSAIAALAWTIGEADRRNAVVRAVMAWSEGDYGGLGGPVGIVAALPSLAGRTAHQFAADSISRCSLRTESVDVIAHRGMPSSSLVSEAAGADLLVVGAGRSTVFGHRVLGAISLACVARSPVPVVIVPDHATRTDTR